MTNESRSGLRRKRRWIRIAILVLIAGVLLASASWLPTFSAASMAQNAASISAWVGAYRLADAIQGSSTEDDHISASMLDRAAQYGLGDDDHLVGHYLDAKCRRIGQVGSGMPQDPHGIEAVVTVHVRILGLDSWSVTRKAQSFLQVERGDDQVIRVVPPSPMPKLFDPNRLTE